NRLGWLFLAAAAVTALSVAAKTYAARIPPDGLPGAAWAGWALTISLGVAAPLLFLIPLLFPDGRPPSPRWRPVVWVAVFAGLVVGGYAGLVILAGVLGFSTPPAVAIATLAAAALFSPLRRRVQRAVDKRFNRVRYDAELTTAAFAARLRDAVDLDIVRAELL